jgi:hypothetical protein
MSNMTFGVNALDWSNIGRTLQTHLAETVGEALTLVSTPIGLWDINGDGQIPPFIYYDGETDTELARYNLYFDIEDTIEYAVTTKVNEEGEIVIDKTIVPAFYQGVNVDNYPITTDDLDLITEMPDENKDEEGNPIPLNVSGTIDFISIHSINRKIIEIFKSAVHTDTGWAPDIIAAQKQIPTSLFSELEIESEVINSDGTSWMRIRKVNGKERIYYTLPYSSDCDINVGKCGSIPDDFTFDLRKSSYIFPIGTDSPKYNTFSGWGTEIPGDSVVSKIASTVETTSLASTMLSSTYETSLDNLKTDYEAVLSGTYIGGGGDTSGSTDCPDNATYNTTDAKCECNDDGTWKGAYTLKGSECVPGFGMIISSKITNGKSLVEENKLIVAGTAVVLLGGLVWTSGMFRDSQKTQGQVLGMKVRTTKKGI